MSYQVLYRAWRPKTFSEIVGQDAIVRTLRRQVLTGRIAHAYLFCGTRGTGKTTASKVLARAINCLNPHDGDPCGECAVCRSLLEETCMDVVEIDAASNNGVDEIRDLRDKVRYPPSFTRYRVYIIDEVHMLSTGAFNALLKTLEEPPAHAVFILATTEPHRLPATILSRCQRFDFHRISAEVIVQRLKVVLEGIGRTAEEEALYEIARASEGAMRDALSLLDSCLSYTDNTVTLQLAKDVLGTAGRGFMFDFTDALLDFDAGRALSLIGDAMDRGLDPLVFLRDAGAHLRGIVVAGAVEEPAALLEVTPEDAARMKAQAGRIDPDRLSRLLDLFLHSEAEMRWASRPRTLLELAAVRACHPEKEETATEEERLSRIEALLAKGAVPAAPVKAQPAAPKPPAASGAARNRPAAPRKAVEPPQAYLDGIEQLRQANPSLAAMLPSMQFVGFENGVLTASFPTALLQYKRVLEKRSALLEQAFGETFGEPVQLRLQTESETREKAAPDSRQIIGELEQVFTREKLDLEN